MHTGIESSTPPASTDAERYMLDVIKRFHRSRCYMLLAIRRTERGGQRLFLTATEFRPRRRGSARADATLRCTHSLGYS